MNAVGFGGGSNAVTSAATTSFIGIGIALCTYYISGVSLTLYNKWFIRDYRFTFPLTLILCHMIMNSLLSFITLRSCGMTTSYKNSRRLIPIGVLFGADIALTAVAFSLISVALCEVVKSGIPLIIMIADSVRHRQVISGKIIMLRAMVITILTIGIAMTSFGDMTFGWLGFTAAVGATICGVFKLLLVEYVLTEVDDTQQNTIDDTAAINNEDALTAASSPTTIMITDDHSLTEKYDTELILTDAPSDGIVYDNQDDEQHHHADDRPDSTMAAGTDTQELNVLSSLNGRSHSYHHHHSASDSSIYDSEGGEADELRRHASPGNIVSHALTSSTNNTPSRAIKPSSSQTSLIDLSRGGARSSSAASDISQTTSIQNDHSSQQQQHEQPQTSATNTQQYANGHTHTNHDHHELSNSSVPSTTSTTTTTTSSPASSKKTRLNPLVSLYYFSPVSAVMLIPISITMEWTDLRSSEVVATNDNIIFTILLILFGSILAFALNVSELFVIQITSALTLCVLASAKFLVVVWASQAIFEANTTMSWINIYGNIISVVGVTLYNALKAYEMTVDQAAAATAAMVAESNQSLALAKKKSEVFPVAIPIKPETSSNGGGVSDEVGVSVEMASYRKSRRKNKQRYAPLMMSDDVDMSEDSTEDDADDNDDDTRRRSALANARDDDPNQSAPEHDTDNEAEAETSQTSKMLIEGATADSSSSSPKVTPKSTPQRHSLPSPPLLTLQPITDESHR